MRLLICPPVTLWHPPEAIRVWIAQLAAMRESYANDAEAIGCIDRAASHAANMLQLATELAVANYEP